MPFRLRYDAYIDFIPPGTGLGQTASGSVAGAVGPGPAGPAQTIQFFNGFTNTLPPTTNTFLTADVTTLTNAMAADIAAQLNVAAVLARIQAFASGGG
jgi:hypothetical protein